MHKMPSDRALKAIALKAANPTMSKRQAALEAGFSLTTAHNAAQNIFEKPLVQSWLDNYKYALNKNKVTPQRLASKLNTLLDATVTTKAGEVPDNRIQLETVKVIHDVFGVKAEQSPNLKRRLTIDEYENKEFA